MDKLLLILGISLGINTAACTSHAVRGSTTAHALNKAQVASSPAPSYREVPFVIESTPTRTSTTSHTVRGSTTAQVLNATQLASSPAPSYREVPFIIESTPTRTGATSFARWYRIAPQHPLMSDGRSQQAAMLPQ